MREGFVEEFKLAKLEFSSAHFHHFGRTNKIRGLQIKCCKPLIYITALGYTYGYTEIYLLLPSCNLI